MLATLKIDAPDLKQLSIKLRTAEGVHGSLSLYMLPKPDPSLMVGDMETCSTLEVPLKPLNLHERV
jgi:hypothetical protein